MLGVLLRALRIGLPALSLAAGGCACLDQHYGYRTTYSSIKDTPIAAAPANPKVVAAPPKRMEPPAAARPKPPSRSSPEQLAEEAACISVDQCASVLKAMIDDPDRSWMRRPASATTLANGVRLFAYRTLRPKLSCSELTTALHELTIARAAYAGPVAGLQKSQIDRARALSAEVDSELRTERANRCRGSTGQALDIRQGAMPTADPATAARRVN
jgi:hypothetical protein